jgi:transposase-like protein
MALQRRTYHRECKLDVIRLCQTTERSVREVEDDLGITQSLLCR